VKVNPPHDTDLLGLMAAGRAGTRVRAIQAINDGLPRELCLEIARRGLADRSRLVRHGATEVCRCYLFTELLSEVDATAATEAHPPTRREMQIAAGLIRDVYFRYARDDGSPAFVVRVSDGRPASMLWPGLGWCPEPRDDREAREFADRIRRQLAHTWRPFRWDRGPAKPGAAPDRGRM